MAAERRGRRGRVQQVVRVAAMRDVDVMPLVAKRMRQPVQVDGVAAEAPRRVERRQVEEVQGP
jgi:hypothetical protein